MKITELIDFKTFTYNWDKIESIPEFAILKECEQNPKWHAEGNAWVHTKLVCEAAVDFCKQFHWEHEVGYTSLLLTSALFHDIGKGVTTRQGKDGRWHAYGHEIESEKITRRLLWDSDFDHMFRFREDVCSLVRCHMMPLQVFESKNMLEKIAEISRNVPYWHILILLKKCDIIGSWQNDEVSKTADLIKMDSLEKITRQMGCLYKPFLDYSNDYKEYISSQTKKHVDVAVMIGLPGAGKSTISEKLKSGDGVFKDAVIISRDDIRAELGFCQKGQKVVLPKEKEALVSERFNDKMLIAAKCGKPIILDNLNIRKEYRLAYRTVLSNYDVTWHYYYIEAPTLDENMKRRNGEINDNTFFDMIGKFEMPMYDEYDSFVCIKTDEKPEIPCE